MRMPGRRSSCTLLTLAGILGLAGCGAAPVVRPIEAVPVVVTESQAPAAGFRIRLEVSNPSDEDVPLDRFEYVFEVAEVGRFEGRWAALRTLPPGGSATIVVPASFALPPDLPGPENDDGTFDWRIDGGVRYQAPGFIGQILFDVGVRRPTEPFSGSGTFRLLPQTEPSPPAGSTSGSGAAD